MIVGRDSTLARAGTVRARSSLARAGRRTCRVGTSTPLAALLASLRRAHLAYRIRDFGDCSRRTAAGSGQLYVSRIGAERGRGSDGWFYKVNDRAPEVGAGDPSAATLRRDDRVLWFYCVFDEGEKSCQRSLRLLPVSGAAAGNAVRVRVRGYDNAGRSAAVPGATVRLGVSSGLSGADGIATVAVPDDAPAGHPALVAEKSGMVPSFPLGLEKLSGR
jgi:hypothetical protein